MSMKLHSVSNFWLFVVKHLKLGRRFTPSIWGEKPADDGCRQAHDSIEVVGPVGPKLHDHHRKDLDDDKDG